MHVCFGVAGNGAYVILWHASLPEVSSSLCSISSPCMAAHGAAAAAPLDASQVTEILERQGYELPGDLAGLSISELQEELEPHGTVELEILETLRQQGLRQTLKRRTAPLSFKQFLPGPSLDPGLPPSAASPVMQSGGSLRPAQPCQRRTGAASDQGSLLSISRALVGAVVQRGFSTHWATVADIPSTQARHDWLDALASSIAGRFELGTITAAYRIWRRLMQWLLDEKLALERPAPKHLRRFLAAQRERGRTVPQTALRQFQWLQQYLGAELSVDSPLFADFRAARNSTLPAQAEVLPLKAWHHLVQIVGACREEETWTGLQLSVALVLRYIVSSLRFKHTKRTEFAPDLSSARSLVWRVTKGKDGQPFAKAVPSHLQPAVPLFSKLRTELQVRFGGLAPFLPEAFYRDGTEEVIFEMSPAKYHRFVQFVRSLLRLSPLSLDETECEQITTYQFRRFLPTVADVLQLTDSKKLCLGNWNDGVKLPLTVRYSAQRLETAAGVRRLSLSAIHHLLKYGLRSVQEHLPQHCCWLLLMGPRC